MVLRPGPPIRSDVNAPLAFDEMKRRPGVQYVKYLGRFTQVGTTALIEARLYRTAPGA